MKIHPSAQRAIMYVGLPLLLYSAMFCESLPILHSIGGGVGILVYLLILVKAP